MGNKKSKQPKDEISFSKIVYLPYQYGSSYANYYYRYAQYFPQQVELVENVIGHTNSESGGSLFARQFREKTDHNYDGIVIQIWNRFNPDMVPYEMKVVPYPKHAPLAILYGNRPAPYYDTDHPEGSTEEAADIDDYHNKSSTPSHDEIHANFKVLMKGVKRNWNLFIFDRSIDEVLEPSANWLIEQLKQNKKAISWFL